MTLNQIALWWVFTAICIILALANIGGIIAVFSDDKENDTAQGASLLVHMLSLASFLVLAHNLGVLLTTQYWLAYLAPKP